MQVGLQEVGENDAPAPAGRPDALNVTAWVVPPGVKVAVTLLVTDNPWVTLVAPPLVREKSNGGGGGGGGVTTPSTIAE